MTDQQNTEPDWRGRLRKARRRALWRRVRFVVLAPLVVVFTLPFALWEGLALWVRGLAYDAGRLWPYMPSEDDL